MISPVILRQTEQGAVETRPPSALCGYKEYPPSILLVAARTSQAFQIEQALENNGCQVCWTEANSEGLDRASQKYFDFMVLDLDPSVEPDLAVPQMLKRYPELAALPAAILTSCDRSSQRIDSFKKAPVYFLAKGSCAGQRLRQIIEQVHYLTYRYLALACS